MSAPTLHPPARMRPVLRERLERQWVAHCFGAVALAGLAVYLRVDSVQVSYSAPVACVVLGGFVLPVLQGIGPDNQPVWDTPLPVDPARYARICLLCGVAGAAFLLAVVVGLYAALFGDPGYPGWYPLALFGWGLTAYLVASAALLRAEYQVAFVVYPVLCLVFVALLLACLEQPEELGRMGMTAVLARTALLLGLVGAAAYATGRFPGRAPEPAGPAARHARAPWNSAEVRSNRPAPLPSPPAPLRSRLAPSPDRPVPPPLRGAGLARPSATLTVFRRHLALLRRFAIVPALTLPFAILLVTAEPVLDLNQTGEGPTLRWFVKSTDLGGWCAFIALSWSVLVWVAERDPRRRWNDTLPVGTAKRRILHATAGAAWLLLFLPVLVAAPLGPAVAAGMLTSPAEVPTWLWLGFPVRTLTVYLAATFVLFGIRVAWDVFFPVALILLSPATSLVESRMIAVTEDVGSHAAAVLWLVAYAAAAAGAIVLNEWIRQLDRSPTAREVRGFLHGWAGTRRSPSLRGHAGR